MTQDTRSRLLEVVVINRGRQSWEWQVLAGDQVLVVGSETTRIAAQFAGNDAMFLALVAGTKAAP